MLSAAIDQSVYVTVSRKFDDAVRVSYSRTEEVANAAQVEHPLVRESLALLGIEGGIEITSVADIPARGTGLGSSSSFTVGLLNALHAYSGRYANAARLAEESCQVEIERCNEPIGKQDQYAAAFGGFNFIRFHPDDSVEVKKVLCAPSLIADLQSRLLFFYTGLTRSASSLLRQQSADVAAPGPKSDATAELVRLAEAAFADLCAGNISSLGCDARCGVASQEATGQRHELRCDRRGLPGREGCGRRGRQTAGRRRRRLSSVSGAAGAARVHTERAAQVARDAVSLRSAWQPHYFRALIGSLKNFHVRCH